MQRKNTELVETFFNTDGGIRIAAFFSWFNKEIKSNKWDIVIFVGERTYWIFQIVSSYYKLNWNNVKCYREKSAISEYNEAIEGKNIALVKDTMETSKKIFSIYKQLKRCYKNANITPIVVNLMTNKIIEDNLINPNDNWEKECLSQFKKDTGNFYQGSYNSLGEYLYKTTQLMQDLMLPYAANFPFITSKTSTKQDYFIDLEKEEDNRISIMDKNKFYQFIEGNDMWDYIDTSYYLPGETKEIKNGFFIYKGREFDNISGFLYAAIIKCRYEIDDSNVRIVFTPTIILNSINQTAIQQLFKIIYKNKYDKFSNINDNKEENNTIYRFMSRSISYFFTFYLGKIFNDYLATYNMEIKPAINLDDSSSPFFQNLQNDLNRCNIEFFNEALKNLPILNSYEPYTDFDSLDSISQSELIDRTYRMIYFEMMNRKRKIGSSKNTNLLTLNDIINIVYNKINYPSNNCRKNCIIAAIQKMLDTDVLCSEIKYGSLLMYGYNSSNNIDIIIPFFDRYVLYAITQLFWKIQNDSSDTTEKTFKEDYFKRFLDDLYNFLYERYLIGTIINPRNYELIRQHLTINWTDLEKLIEKMEILLENTKKDDVYYNIQKFVLTKCPLK